MMKKSLLGALVVLGLSGSAFAQDATGEAPVVNAPVGNTPVVEVPVELTALEAAFLSADTYFAARDDASNALANTLAARAGYQGIVNSGVTGADLVRAVEGVARTYYFQGEVLIGKDTDAEKKARKAIWNECWKSALLPLAPETFGAKTAVYYYFRASCLAHEAEVSSVLERLLSLPTLLGTFSDGFEAPGISSYEGGGLARVKAAIKGNIEAKGLPGGLFNPEEALSLIETSIASTATNPGDIDGALFCENYYRKALTLNLIDGRKAEAKALTEQTAADFEAFLADGTLIPEPIRAETAHCVSEITKFGATIVP